MIAEDNKTVSLPNKCYFEYMSLKILFHCLSEEYMVTDSCLTFRYKGSSCANGEFCQGELTMSSISKFYWFSV